MRNVDGIVFLEAEVICGAGEAAPGRKVIVIWVRGGPRSFQMEQTDGGRLLGLGRRIDRK